MSIIGIHMFFVYCLVALEFSYLFISQCCKDINKFISRISIISPIQIIALVLVLLSGMSIEATKAFFNFKIFLFLSWILIFYLSIRQLVIFNKIKKAKKSFNFKLFSIVFEILKIFLIIFAGVTNSLLF